MVEIVAFSHAREELCAAAPLAQAKPSSVMRARRAGSCGSSASVRSQPARRLPSMTRPSALRETGGRLHPIRRVQRAVRRALVLSRAPIAEPRPDRPARCRPCLRRLRRTPCDYRPAPPRPSATGGCRRASRDRTSARRLAIERDACARRANAAMEEPQPFSVDDRAFDVRTFVEPEPSRTSPISSRWSPHPTASSGPSRQRRGRSRTFRLDGSPVQTSATAGRWRGLPHGARSAKGATLLNLVLGLPSGRLDLPSAYSSSRQKV